MKHILLIDADPEIVALLQQFLEKQELRVTAGACREDMWHALEEHVFDLIVLDVLLPGKDGPTLCREVGAQSDVPILILTALDVETDRIVGLEIGADDYLVKPFSPRELLARIRAILRRDSMGAGKSQEVEQTVFQFAGPRFDTRRRELRAANDLVINLSRTEFDLLRVFVRRPQEVMDRNEISELLRGYELGAFDRSIDLHVSRLRTKLTPLISNEQFIRTIRGTGYMFTLDVTTSA